jgi:hypothetical protein
MEKAIEFILPVQKTNKAKITHLKVVFDAGHYDLIKIARKLLDKIHFMPEHEEDYWIKIPTILTALHFNEKENDYTESDLYFEKYIDVGTWRFILTIKNDSETIASEDIQHEILDLLVKIPTMKKSKIPLYVHYNAETDHETDLVREAAKKRAEE